MIITTSLRKSKKFVNLNDKEYPEASYLNKESQRFKQQRKEKNFKGREKKNALILTQFEKKEY